MEKYNFIDFEDNYMADGGLWMKVRPDNTMKTIELWNMIKVKHLAN